MFEELVVPAAAAAEAVAKQLLKNLLKVLFLCVLNKVFLTAHIWQEPAVTKH